MRAAGIAHVPGTQKLDAIVSGRENEDTPRCRSTRCPISGAVVLRAPRARAARAWRCAQNGCRKALSDASRAPRNGKDRKYASNCVEISSSEALPRPHRARARARACARAPPPRKRSQKRAA
jgi:hypothetical protein